MDCNLWLIQDKCTLADQLQSRGQLVHFLLTLREGRCPPQGHTSHLDGLAVSVSTLGGVCLELCSSL